MAGKWFDELEVGQVFQHALRRTLTETDNLLFTTMTHNPAHSMFTMGLVVGISVGDTTLGTAVANLSIDNTTFPKPVFPGDTLRVETEIIALRESKSRPTQGIVTFEHRAFNQRDELVLTFLAKAQNRHTGLIDVNDINAPIMLIAHHIHRTKVEPHGFAEFN